jgi:hypothetical protein
VDVLVVGVAMVVAPVGAHGAYDSTEDFPAEAKPQLVTVQPQLVAARRLLVVDLDNTGPKADTLQSEAGA